MRPTLGRLRADIRTLGMWSDRLLDPSQPASAAFRAAIDERISAFLDRQSEQLLGMARSSGRSPTSLARPPRRWQAAPTGVLRRRLPGGRRSAGAEPRPGLLDAAASLELLHVSALVHDDVMDALGPPPRSAGGASAVRDPAHHVRAGWEIRTRTVGRRPSCWATCC